MSEPNALPDPSMPTQATHVQQLTASNIGIPSHVWTTDALTHFVDKQAEVIKDNNRSIDKMRGQEFTLSMIGFAFVIAVVGIGVTMMFLNLSGGSELVAAGVAFAGGFFAGRGYGK